MAQLSPLDRRRDGLLLAYFMARDSLLARAVIAKEFRAFSRG
ncbi:MAG: hypothetical protein M0038_01480 [Pseudomonadota bacterium]|jgi:hypothetical protein|nr:hypothetical protein [Pseudomonadota bacterium]